MRKTVLVGTILLLIVVLAVGCHRVPQEEFDAVIVEKEAALAKAMSLQEQLNDVQNTLNSVNAGKETIETEVKAVQDQLTNVQAEITRVTAQIDSSKAEIIELKAKIDVLGLNIKNLQKEIAYPKVTEKPQYGGTATIMLSTAPAAFDEAFQSQILTPTLHLTNDELLQGDWTEGPACTGKSDFILPGINSLSLKTSSLAVSWEMPGKGKMIFHIRPGVHWHNKAPTNGRELTVDDVVFSLKRICIQPTSYIKSMYPNLCNSVSIKGDVATNAVTIECPADEWVNAISVFPDFVMIVPRDAVEQFGNLNDWRNSIGTGAFILTDYVASSSATFNKNPNYWETNPIGPGRGDQLPYLDSIKMLVVSDASTRIAAFRTRKVDNMSGEYDFVKAIIDDPTIKRVEYTPDYSMVISMRTDRTDMPFSKKEVRQALTLAIDFQLIKNAYYSGKADIFNWPICYVKEYSGAYVPLENLPTSCQELYSHNLNKAKELLTAVGYPYGFPVTITTPNIQSYLDYLSVIKSMWTAIGINTTIQVVDLSVYYAMVATRNYGSMIYHSSSPNWMKMQNFTGTSQYNMSYVNDVYLNQALARAMEFIGTDEAQLAQNFADIVPYVAEQCFQISKPNPYNYVLWWTWVKNWNGELNVGYYNYPSYLKYTWTDQALYKQTTGR